MKGTPSCPCSRRPVFVVVEGLDGCGKSSVARALAATLPAILEQTPPAELRGVRPCLDEVYEKCPNARTLFYGSTVDLASARVRALMREGRSVVLDRYWISTRAYSELRGADLQLDAIERDLLVPTLTVFLDAPADVRARRMAGRAGNSREDHRTLDPDADAFLRRAFTEHGRRWCGDRFVVVDASAPLDEVVARVIARLAEVDR